MWFVARWLALDALKERHEVVRVDTADAVCVVDVVT